MRFAELPPPAIVTTSSVVVAQALSAALAAAFGLAFIGLWFEYRQRSMVVLSRAWLLYGVQSASTPLLSERVFDVTPSTGLTAITLALALATVLLFLDAALVIAGRDALRRHAWTIGGGIAIAGLAGLVARIEPMESAMYGAGPRSFAVTGITLALVVVLRAAPFAGRRYLAAGFLFLLVRFGAGLAIELFGAGVISAAGQPMSFTLLQLLTLTLAGYYMTAAAFALEHEATLRAQLALQKRLGLAQRQASVGLIAGSVAHDFNNILMAVLGATDSLETSGSAASQAEVASDLRATVERGRALTQQLMGIARPDVGHQEAFDPRARVEGLVPMIRRLVGDAIRVELAAPVEAIDGVVRANPVQFDQVLLNFAANARDAMPSGGVLSIAVTAEASGATRTDGRSAGPRARIVVRDTGTGMPPEVAEHVFDPYFTTKPSGKGTGLGLATAFSFATHAGGELSVVTAPGSGATFTLALPLEGRPGRPA